MDTMELMNEETVNTATDALSTAGTAIANAASAAIQAAPEIRYVEVPVEGPANIGAFFLGAAATGVAALLGFAGIKLKKRHDAKKAAKTEPTVKTDGSIEGYERKTEQAEAQQTTEPGHVDAEPVKGEVVDKKPEKK